MLTKSTFEKISLKKTSRNHDNFFFISIIELGQVLARFVTERWKWLCHIYNRLATIPKKIELKILNLFFFFLENPRTGWPSNKWQIFFENIVMSLSKLHKWYYQYKKKIPVRFRSISVSSKSLIKIGGAIVETMPAQKCVTKIICTTRHDLPRDH